MQHDVFISYSHKDKESAATVCGALEAAGVRCWMAPRDVPPGHDWRSSITEAIEGCRAVVLVLSENSNVSPDVHQEIGIGKADHPASAAGHDGPSHAAVLPWLQALGRRAVPAPDEASADARHGRHHVRRSRKTGRPATGWRGAGCVRRPDVGPGTPRGGGGVVSKGGRTGRCRGALQARQSVRGRARRATRHQ